MNRNQIREALRPVFHVYYDYEITGDCSIKPYNEDDQNIIVEMLNGCDEMPNNRIAFYDDKDNLIVICLKEGETATITESIADAERDFDAERCKIENNINALEGYIASMNCAIEKAAGGSKVEQGYFLEKLEKMCNRLGFNMIER